MLLSPAKSTMQIKEDALWNFKLVIMFISKLVHLRALKDFKKRASLLLAMLVHFGSLQGVGQWLINWSSLNLYHLYMMCFMCLN